VSDDGNPDDALTLSDRDAARAVYARLWAAAQAQFARGSVQTDPHLVRREADTRRGLTLLLRPSGEAKANLTAVLDELRTLAPRQHLYHPDELHITLLSVISASAGLDLAAAPIDAFHAALSDAIAGAAPFRIRLQGVSAAPDTVFVYGEAEPDAPDDQPGADDALNSLRDRVRESLRAAALDAQLERRYRSVTAHLSVLRFRSQPADLSALAAYLDRHHQRDLGAFTVREVLLVSNDWYMSRDRVRVLHRYPLRGNV
jgi:2'-5' RNA ligase